VTDPPAEMATGSDRQQPGSAGEWPAISQFVDWPS
jgi:hypothetical protein